MKAVVFDLDGTLLDVREAFYWQFERLSEEFDGAALARSVIAASAHGTTEEIVRTLIRNTDVPFGSILKRHEELRLEAYERYLKLYDGVADLLPILKRMGFGVAALTAGNQLTIDCLHQTDVHRHFDTIVDASRVVNSKPDPEGLQIIMTELGAAPHEITMVGDSVVDVLVGKNAGIAKTVGVSHGFGHVEALIAAGADHIIHDIPTLLDVLE